MDAGKYKHLVCSGGVSFVRLIDQASHGGDWRAPKRCPACRSIFAPVKRAQKGCGLPRCKMAIRRGTAPLDPKHCAHCASVFTPQRRRASLYCGIACKVNAWRMANPDAIARHRKAAAEKQEPPPPSSPVYFNSCRCGAQWTGKRKATRCGQCRKGAERDKARVRAEAAHKLAGRSVSCTRCGCTYCPLYGAKTSGRPHCQPCAADARRAERKARQGTHRKRAIRYGAPYEKFNPVQVLQRDGWRCWVCGLPTPRELRGTTHPDAPELDHVIPVARGGPHSMANTKCACRACNSARGDRVPTEELLRSLRAARGLA